MTETWINLSCPRCNKTWSDSPTDLPDLDTEFTCPECEVVATMAEFLKTSRDLEIYKSLAD